MRKNMNQQERYARGIYRKMLGNLIIGAGAITIMIACNACTNKGTSGTTKEANTEKDSVTVQDSTGGWETGNTVEVQLTEQTEAKE